MPPAKRVKFLLVFVGTYSGWIEAFPTTNKRASTVARLILTEILPRFGMPSSLQSDNRPKFTSQITQNIARALQVPWRFHIPYHPQSSGKVERANWVLKETLTKLTIELHQDWTKLLLLALLKVRALQKNKTKQNPKTLKYQSIPGQVWEAHSTIRPPSLPGWSQTATIPSFSFTCPDTRCPLSTYGWSTPSTTSQSSIPIPSNRRQSLYDNSVPLRSNAKMARSLRGNSADPYCCKIKRNHPLGTHHLVKKGYAAQLWKLLPD